MHVAAVEVDPETGRVNVGTYRMMIKGPREVGVYTSPGKDATIDREKWWKMGKPMPCAVVLGCPPAVSHCMPSRRRPATSSHGIVRGQPSLAIGRRITRGPAGSQTLIAATGDHTMRTTGLYTTPSRRVLQHRVPLMVWGAGTATCPDALDAPASHLDIFPTLLPLLGIAHGYLHTGRDLMRCDTASLRTGDQPQTTTPMAVTMLGGVRTATSGPRRAR